jgi:uncharacterized protein YndB with AHSA1/START domain
VTSTPGHPQAGAAGPLVVEQSVHVPLTPGDAFRLFTDGIGEWWPLEEGFSYGGDRAHKIFLEPVEGGRFYECFVDGDELQVGTVVVCAPPDRVVFTWRSPDWQAETEVEVRFLADPSGTNVELAHRGWERLGADAETCARTWANGWPRVVSCFAGNAHG